MPSRNRYSRVIQQVGLWTLLSSCTTVLTAQNPGSGGPPFGPPGMGGPGFGGPGFGGPGPLGMMMMSPPGAEGALIVLIQMPEVQAELTLTEEQKKAVQGMQQALEIQGRKERDEMGLLMALPLTDEERQDAIRKFFQDIATKLSQKDAEVIAVLNADQNTRIKQLSWQRQGLAALASKEPINQELVTALNLTEEQRKTIESTLTQQRNSTAPGFGGPPGMGGGRPLNSRMDAELNRLLSEAQRARWIEIKGKAFTFPEPRMGPPGGGGPMGQEVALVDKHDKDKNGWLDREERQSARVEAKSMPRGGPGGGRGGPGGPGGGFGPPGMERDGNGVDAQAVAKRLTPGEVKTFPDAPLYDPKVLRTVFIDFEAEDWESELEDFKSSDVEVTAKLTVDGKVYPQVGISFRGSSSYFMLRAGQKRSMNVALDLVNPDQRLYGYKSLNLLNSNDDPTFMHVVLYSYLANQHIPTPKANLVRVVINGESWGLYPNVQQFDKQFLKEFYGTTKGTRWKVPGHPGGGGSLGYLGDNVSAYERLYEIKTNDGAAKSWQDLIRLCKTLNEAPLDELQQTIEPMLDLDGVLWFLALDVALVNSDGYWIRGSDYNLYRDDKKVFHIIPHDMNESFQPAMGPGAPGGFGGGPGNTSQLHPLVGLDDPSKPLRSRLLEIPELRKRYLHHVGVIARDGLEWNRLGPFVKELQTLIDEDVKADTRKLSSYAAFEQALAEEFQENQAQGRRRVTHLRSFLQQRRDYLLALPEVREAIE